MASVGEGPRPKQNSTLPLDPFAEPKHMSMISFSLIVSLQIGKIRLKIADTQIVWENVTMLLSL